MIFTEEKITYLLCFMKHQKEEQTVTNIASKLGVSKSTISKVLSVFYNEGYIVEKGKIKLSKKGVMVAKQWHNEIEQISQWLINHGNLQRKNAEKEALRIALCMSDEVKQALLQQQIMDNFLNDLDDIKMMYGDMLLMQLKEGDYPFAFTIYKDQVEHTLELSMANDAFYHPGILRITKGNGHMILKNKVIDMLPHEGHALVKATLEELFYFKEKELVRAQAWKDSFLIPVTIFVFYYNAQERLLQGHVRLQMKPTVKAMQMPISTAILSVVFK